MEWIILFIINWMLFFLLVNWKELKINIWSGVMAVAMAIVVEFLNIAVHGLYVIHHPIINILGSSLFFLLGPVFVTGTLMAQYHPKKRWVTILNVFVIVGLYSLLELTLVFLGAVEYLNWNYFDSVIVNFGAMVALSWFSITVLGKWGD